MYSCGTYPLVIASLLCSLIAVAGALAALLTPRWYIVQAGGEGWREFSLTGVCDKYAQPIYESTTTTTAPTTAAPPPYSAPYGTCNNYGSFTFDFASQFFFRTTTASVPASSGFSTLPPSQYECPVSSSTMEGYFLTTIGLGSAGVAFAGLGMLTILVDLARWLLMRNRIHRKLTARKVRRARRLKRRRDEAAAAAASLLLLGGDGGGVNTTNVSQRRNGSIAHLEIDLEEGDGGGDLITGTSDESKVVDDTAVSIVTLIAAALFGLATIFLVAAVSHFATVFDAGKPFCNGEYGDACDLLQLYDDQAFHFSECEATYGYSFSLAILSWVSSLCAFALLLTRIISILCCKVTNMFMEDVDGDGEDDVDSEVEQLEGVLLQEDEEMMSSTILQNNSGLISSGSGSSITPFLQHLSGGGGGGSGPPPPPRPGTDTKQQQKANKKKKKEEEERYKIAAAKEHQNKQFNPVDMYRNAHMGEDENDEDGNGDGGLAALTTVARPPADEGMEGVEDLDLVLPEENISRGGGGIQTADYDSDYDDLLLATTKSTADINKKNMAEEDEGGGGFAPQPKSGAEVTVEKEGRSTHPRHHPGEPEGVDLPVGNWEWDPEAELFWSEEKEYFFDHQSGQFYDPNTEQWYNRQTGKWYSL